MLTHRPVHCHLPAEGQLTAEGTLEVAGTVEPVTFTAEVRSSADRGLRIGDLLDARRRRPVRSFRLAHYEVMVSLASVQGYSAWIQLTKSSRLTVSSRAGWSVDMCPRIIPSTNGKDAEERGSNKGQVRPDRLSSTRRT